MSLNDICATTYFTDKYLDAQDKIEQAYTSAFDEIKGMFEEQLSEKGIEKDDVMDDLTFEINYISDRYGYDFDVTDMANEILEYYGVK